MKVLFSDNTVSKIRRIPSPIWVVFVIISFFFANAYIYLLEGEYMANQVCAIYAEMGLNVNNVTMGILVVLLESALSAIIAEVIIAIVYNVAASRHNISLNRQDFKFRLRYMLIISNLIIGILSIGYFFTQAKNNVYTGTITLFKDTVNMLEFTNPYYNIQSSVLPFIVYSLVLFAFYDDFKTRYVAPRNQANLFANAVKIFIGINLLLFLWNVFQNFLIIENQEQDIYIIIAYCLKGVSIIAISILAYFYYKKLKKISDEQIFATENTSNHKDNIYDDFGF